MIGADQYQPILAWSDRIGIGKIADQALPITLEEVCEELSVYGDQRKAVNVFHLQLMMSSVKEETSIKLNSQFVFIQSYSSMGFYLFHLFIASIAIVAIDCCLSETRRGSHWGHDIIFKMKKNHRMELKTSTLRRNGLLAVKELVTLIVSDAIIWL